MRLSSVTILLATAAYVSAYPLLHWRKRDVNPAIVPDFGWESGVNPTGTGDCDGAPGTNVKIPCFCPPPRDVMLKALNENIAAGYSVNNTVVSFDFPTDNSIQSEIARINGVLVTLQNLSGPGVGCPAASTTLNARRKALQDQLASGKVNVPATPVITTTTTSTSIAASTTTATPSGSADFRAQVAVLAPELGFQSGVNPDGTGNCDGAIPGGPKIPCQCPPPRDEFISQLQDNAVAGRAVHSPDGQGRLPPGRQRGKQEGSHRRQFDHDPELERTRCRMPSGFNDSVSAAISTRLSLLYCPNNGLLRSLFTLVRC